MRKKSKVHGNDVPVQKLSLNLVKQVRLRPFLTSHPSDIAVLVRAVADEVVEGVLKHNQPWKDFRRIRVLGRNRPAELDGHPENLDRQRCLLQFMKEHRN
jgi:hypothetical protein